ncbi:MAG: TfoX/Sxy family protein [Verrucomicrobiae bacterium]|nr:TfoX/Sxy family protein [Verrucomicrobiae bacterium]
MKISKEYVSPLARMRNLGPKSAELIESIGIFDAKALANAGTLEVCHKLILAGHVISLNMAYAIQGALMDCDWRRIPIEFRRYLAVEFKKIKSR